jgi:S1-C subfamily serine protease
MRTPVCLLGVLAATLAVAGPSRAQVVPYRLGIKYTMTRQGMRIDAVLPKSAASVAELEPGDYLVSVNGKLIANPLDYLTALHMSKGGVANLIVRRPKTNQVKPIRVALGVGVKGGIGRVPYQLGVQGQFTPIGLRIVTVTAKSPAAKVGLKPADTIIRIDGQAITGQLVFQRALQTSGGAVEMAVRKASGRLVVLKAKLAGGGNRKPFQLGIHYTIKPEGARINAVLPRSAAARAGLARGDIILNINGCRIRTNKDYEAALEQSFGFLQMIVRTAATGRAERVAVDLLGPAVWR